MSLNASRMFFERSPRIGEVDRRRQLRLERRQQRADGVGHRDGVAARLPHHLQVDRAPRAGLGVEPRRVLVVLDVVEDVGDLVEPDRGAVPVRDHDRLERVGVHQLSAGLDVVGRRRAEQLSGRHVDVPVLQRLVHFVEADALGVQLVRIDLHADRVLLRALHLHLRHAADHRDARRDHRLGVVVERRTSARRPRSARGTSPANRPG